MEANLILEGTNKTPLVNFSLQTGVLELGGKSIPENSFGFYQPLLNWIDEYSQNPQTKTDVKITLEYFNTSSSKCLLDIFRKLSALHQTGKSNVEVFWYYEEEDEDMMEAGQDYESLVDLKFSIIKL